MNRRREWNEIGGIDPLWAILSAPEKRHGRWSLEEFFLTGQVEVERVLERGRQWHLPAESGMALDFGCGVGRLTRALGGHFRFALGLDLSDTMVDRARQLNSDVDNVSFRTLSESPPSSIADHSFDLVYSSLVLQHVVSQRIIEAALLGFVRALKVDGLLVFQLPSRIPFRRRLQLRPRLYAALRAANVPHSVLYDRLGLHPIRMTAMAESKVVSALEAAGATILAIDRRTLPGTGIADRTYFVTAKPQKHQQAQPSSTG